jgi:hypothetical protein
MNVPDPNRDWTDANQRVLVAEFVRLKCLLRGDGADEASIEIERLRGTMIGQAAIDRLADRFGLSAYERDLLLLVAGIEMDSELASLCAAAAPGTSRPCASFGLALAVLPDAHWSALTPTRPLRRWRLVEPADDTSLAGARLRIEERVLHYLAGVNYVDPRLHPLLRPVHQTPAMAPGHERIRDEITATLASCDAPLPLVCLGGNDGHGKRDVAAGVAERCGLQLFALAAEDVPAGAHELEVLASLWEREAALLDAALLVESGDGGPGPAERRLLERLAGLTFVVAREPLVLDRQTLRYRVDKPGRDEQLHLWQRALGVEAFRLAPVLEGVAAELRLSAQDIHRVGGDLALELTAGADGASQLWQLCRAIEGRRLGSLAQRIEPAATWDDLVLPDSQKAILRQIATHLRHRFKVQEQWGFARKGNRGLGIAALFAGESGTGKTMAAEALANELHLELFRIDLSAVVSKYIGETEKNLARVFDAAEDSGAILLFDEADALFGKRSEVKDSHDRYANIEVSYLLQRMEAYRGLAILTTNQKTALDPAFQRRLRFVAHFPFPDGPQREAIWRGIFPAATPTHAIDCAKLARLHVTGGSIRNIALNAAYLAADADQPVDMAHVLQAAHSEAAKRERPLTDSETRGWV